MDGPFREKLATKNSLLIRKLAVTTWEATAHCLRISALGLVYSCAEYYCSTWLNSVHAYKIDVELNRTMKITTGTVNFTPLIWLRPLFDRVLLNDEILLHHDVQNDPIQRLNFGSSQRAQRKDYGQMVSVPVKHTQTDVAGLKHIERSNLIFNFDRHKHARVFTSSHHLAELKSTSDVETAISCFISGYLSKVPVALVAILIKQ